MTANNLPKSDQDWINTIRECHSSGLSDRKWCEVSGISRNSLYYHIRKLRERGYEIPAAVHSESASPKQEVVPIMIRDDIGLPEESRPSLKSGPVTARVFIGNACAEFHDGAGSSTIRNILCALGGLTC